jgi:hypothetical protein
MGIAPTTVSGELVSREDIGKVKKVLIPHNEAALYYCLVIGISGIFPSLLEIWLPPVKIYF